MSPTSPRCSFAGGAKSQWTPGGCDRLFSGALPGRLPCLRAEVGELAGWRPGAGGHHALLRRLGGRPGQAGQAPASHERHIEEVTLKNKIELEEKHARHAKKMQSHHGHSGTDSTGSASSSLHYVNELLPTAGGGEHRKKQRRHRHKERSVEREDHEQRTHQRQQTPDIGVHRGPPKRPSFRQKLFGQTIAHVKLVEAQSDSTDSAGGTGGGAGAGSGSKPGGAKPHPGEKRQRLQRLDTLPLAQVVRVSSIP
ncbi:uncharacterized protein LOC122625321 isoform X2 [Drosophila teissieri]|uniref:uncharacterized protein LOC122625321 isoform X2 n=1 Tax=Drosophila teissieri TaxID=7243 RepID=UPI001CB9EA93|nr:uncharacterized protein LOC122625321 isoform X2 [Drosophila teissieri]